MDESTQGPKKILAYNSPSRSPASMRFYGVLSQKQRRPSTVSKKPPEPIRRAVADCLSSTAPNLHGNSSSLFYEAVRILRDYLANPMTVDMAYNVLLEHTLAERERSPAVVPRCIAILKRYLLRYAPKTQMLRKIDRFCENCIIECKSITKQHALLWSESFSQNSRYSASLSSLPQASSFASASLVKSLNYVRSLVAQQLPKLSIQPSGTNGPSTSVTQSHPSLSSFLSKSITSHLNSEIVMNVDSLQRKEGSVKSSMKMPHADGIDGSNSDRYVYPDLVSWRSLSNSGFQLSSLMGESTLKVHDFNALGFIELGAAALLIDNNEAKVNERTLKYNKSQNLFDAGQLFTSLSAREGTNFTSVDSHLKAIAASKRMKDGPHQIWEKVLTSTFHPRARPLFQYRHYSEQQPLRLNPAEIGEIITEACSEMATNLTFSSPLAKHNARPVAEIAVSVLIKLIIDMYVMNSLSAAPLTFLMLEDMLNSQAVASKIRVFDLILNLGVHAHLLEPVLDESTPAVAEDEVSEDTESTNNDENANVEIHMRKRMALAIENFEMWLLNILFEVLLVLVQTEEREEIVWASALSCLFYFVCERGKILRSRLNALDIRVIKALLEISREHSWAEVVHSKLICMLTNMFYHTSNGSQHILGNSPTFLIEQIYLVGGIDFICLEYSQAKLRENKRNLFLVLFDYALCMINESCIAAGTSPYAFEEVQLVFSMLMAANAPEAFYIAVKYGVGGVGQSLRKSIDGVSPKLSNLERLDQLFSEIITELEVTICTFIHLDNEFHQKLQLTKLHQSTFILDELGEFEHGMRAKLSWVTLHSLLHSERAPHRHHGYAWLVELLISEFGIAEGRSIHTNIERFEQQFGAFGSQDIATAAAPLPIVIMCGLLKSKHNFIRRGFLFVLERILLHCKLLFNEDSTGDQLQRASAVIDLMSCALSLVVQITETDHHNILKMCDVLFSQVCLRVPVDKVEVGHSSSRSSSKPAKPYSEKSSKRDLSSHDFAADRETSSLATLVLRGHAIAPMQLVSRVPASLFYWPLLQLAGAVTDDIALGVAVGSQGRANFPGAISDIRAALLQLLIGKCSADSAAFLEVEGEEFFRGLLDDTDSRVAYYSAVFLLKRMMTEQPEHYQNLLQSLIVKAQQCNNEKLLENPYLQMRGILHLVNDPAG